MISIFSPLEGKTYKLYISTWVWRKTKTFRDSFFSSINMSYIVLCIMYVVCGILYVACYIVLSYGICCLINISYIVWSQNFCLLCLRRSCKRSLMEREEDWRTWGERFFSKNAWKKSALYRWFSALGIERLSFLTRRSLHSIQFIEVFIREFVRKTVGI